MATPKRTAAKPASKPATASFRQLEELWIGAGGQRADAPLMASIALAESGGNPSAEGHNTNGTVDRGLWQINSVHGALSTTNVAANAKAAVKIFKESGASPWVTYKTGAYRKYYEHEGGISVGENVEPLAGLAGIVEGNIPGVSKEGAGEHAATGALESAGANWQELGLNLILILAGAALLVYGVMVMLKPREKALSLPKLGLAAV